MTDSNLNTNLRGRYNAGSPPDSVPFFSVCLSSSAQATRAVRRLAASPTSPSPATNKADPAGSGTLLITSCGAFDPAADKDPETKRLSLLTTASSVVIFLPTANIPWAAFNAATPEAFRLISTNLPLSARLAVYMPKFCPDPRSLKITSPTREPTPFPDT